MSETLAFSYTPSGTAFTNTSALTPAVGTFSNGSLGGLRLTSLTTQTLGAASGVGYGGSGTKLVMTCNADRRVTWGVHKFDGSDEYWNVYVHYVDANNWVQVDGRNDGSFSGAQLRLRKCVAGVTTVIDQKSWSYPDNTDWQYEYTRSSDAVTLKVDGATELSGSLSGALTTTADGQLFASGSAAGDGNRSFSFLPINFYSVSADAPVTRRNRMLTSVARAVSRLAEWRRYQHQTILAGQTLLAAATVDPTPVRFNPVMGPPIRFNPTMGAPVRFNPTFSSE